jgi:hypothetical protein
MEFVCFGVGLQLWKIWTQRWKLIALIKIPANRVQVIMDLRGIILVSTKEAQIY